MAVIGSDWLLNGQGDAFNYSPIESESGVDSAPVLFIFGG